MHAFNELFKCHRSAAVQNTAAWAIVKMNVVFFFSNHGHSSASNTPAALCQQPWQVLQPESPVAVSQDRQRTARGRTRTERDTAKTHTNTDKVGHRGQEVKILDIYHHVFSLDLPTSTLILCKCCSFCQFLYFCSDANCSHLNDNRICC